ncbi:receptor-type tyrosine-protein phosphatase delta-like [Montipora capricornis]|uniref:receptor-type tyrosine-protein phosphatase delta-like n=1 Tax=Montipora capricornis TaxID=246305 RepID=UPI0035F16138
MQVNLHAAITITAIATQGFVYRDKQYFIKSYYLSYGDDGNNWVNYTIQGMTKVFQANVDANSIVKVGFNSSVVGKFIRVHPTNCSIRCALRMELYGCNSTEGIPGRPSPPITTSILATSINITWSAPDYVGDGITGYNVRWEDVGASTPSQKVIVGNKSRVATLSNISPYTNYTIEVQAFNWKGDSPWSFPLTVQSSESVPSSDPVIVKGQNGTKAEDAHTIRVVWEEIPEKDQNGIITGYTVFYNETGQSQYFSKNATASQTSASIGGLKPFTKYCIKVAGYTKVGRSPLTDPCYEVETLQKGPSHPRNVMLQAKSSTSILVSWKEPALQNGEITNYIIYYRKQDGPETEAQVTGSTFQRLLTDLRKFTTYYIKVRGKTTELGNASRLLNATTFEGRASPPTELRGEVTSGTKVVVFWKEPSDKNGVIRKYRIKIYNTKTGEEVGSIEIDAQEYSNGFKKEVTKLTPYTTYTFAVQAVTTEPGEMANFTARTYGEVPGKPREVEATLDDGNIYVFWEEPSNPNGIILKYQIYCVGKREYDRAFQSNLEISTTEDVRFEVIKKPQLSSGTEFTVYITAFTWKGEGSQSEHMVVNTPAVAPPPPTEPQVNYTATTLHTITITIQPASDTNGKVIFHHVIVEILGKVTKRQTSTLPDNINNYEEARTKGETFYMAASLSRDALNTSRVFVLGDGETYGDYKNVQLEPGTRYKAYIRGVTEDNGRFLYGSPTEISLPPTLIPGKPRKVIATLVDGNINVAWEEPINPNGIIRKYQIYCVGKREYDRAFHRNFRVITNEAVRFDVIKKADLSPGTEFTVYITAFISKGEGTQSEHMLVNTPAVAPPPPTEPQVNYEDTTLHTITITIQPASDTNGKVIFHQVIVEIPGKVTKRQTSILPDNVSNYEEARRRGDKFYMAASLSRDALNTSRVFVLGDGETYGDYKNVQLEPWTRYKAYIRGVTEDNGRFLYGSPTEISLPPTLSTSCEFVFFN